MTPPLSAPSGLPAQWPVVEAALDATRLRSDFEAICAFGGRFAGSDGERAATAWLKARLEADLGVAPGIIRLPHDGWRRVSQRLEILGPAGAGGEPGEPSPELACHALVWSVNTPEGGLEAEVLDLGRGTPQEIEARRDEVRGRIVLVRHEYMFWPGTVHRRVKYEAAKAAGAAGYLIANRIPGELLVTGSSGRGGAADIPAAGITFEGAAALAALSAPPDAAGLGARYPRVRLSIQTASVPGVAECLVVDLPGREPPAGEQREWVALSAHIDGHPLAESAMDNATGLAAVLAIARALRPVVAQLPRGLRVFLFNLEEWGVAGSATYLDGLAPAERDAIALNVNLDAIAGDPDLTALTSEFPRLEPWLGAIGAAAGTPLGFYEPLMKNSDHFHFARHGIPALRLVAGFGKQDSALRFVLTPGDTHDVVDQRDLANATRLAAAITLAGCAAGGLDLR